MRSHGNKGYVSTKSFKNVLKVSLTINIPQELSSKCIFKKRKALCKVGVGEAKKWGQRRELVIQSLAYFS